MFCIVALVPSEEKMKATYMYHQTVNPISTRGADYAPHSTTSPPPRFLDLATALIMFMDT